VQILDPQLEVTVVVGGGHPERVLLGQGGVGESPTAGDVHVVADGPS